MKTTWIHSLAFTVGMTAIPGIASAQYTIGNSGAGLAASSFNANTAAPANNAALRNYMAPPAASTMQNGQASLAAYAQGGAVGSGVPGGHVHVPGVPVTENPVLNTQYQAAPTYAAPPVQPYEQMPMAQSQQPAANTYASPYASQPHASPVPTPMSSSCPACSSGSCATHGVGMDASSMVASPACGSGDSCYSEPAMSCGPSIMSPSPWIFGASGLLFNRVDQDYVRLTSDSTMPSDALLSTDSARMQATGGIQLSAGRYFCDGRYAIVGSYWGIFSNPQTASVQTPAGGNLRSNLPFTLRGPNDTATPGMPYGIQMPGQFVYDWYDGAFAHRVVRDQQFNNVELNFFSFALGGGARQPYEQECGTTTLGGRFGAGRYATPSYGGYGSCGDPCGSSCGPVACSTPCSSGPTGPCAPWYGAQCSKLRLNMYGGVRWFQFRDSLEYAASSTDAIYGTTADDFYYRNGVTNDLVGFQLGSLAQWCTGTRFNLFAGTAFGIYGNKVTADTYAGTTTTAATIMSTNSFNGMPYNYSASQTDIAFLGEGNLGVGVRVCRGWTANLGYRVVGVNGVATAVGQIPRDFSLGNDVNKVYNNNSLILHGLVLGAAYNF